MSYSKAIAVQSRKNVNIGVADTTILNSSYLSDFDLNSINKIISEINDVKNNVKREIYWGQEQIMIITDKDFSTCTYEDGIQSPDIKTTTLLNLMIEIKNFKEQYQNPANLKSIIGQAFLIIKSNPSNYKRWPNSNMDFATTINDVYISLVLKPEDLNLSESGYVNQLNTNF